MSLVTGKLETACIDCTKYNPDKQSSEVLALFCHSAYLSVICLASVSQRYIISWMHRLTGNDTCSSRSFILISSLYLQVFYSKKDLKDGCLLIGAIVNAVLGKIVKLLWRQPRPSAM